MSEPTVKQEGNGIHVQYDGGANEPSKVDVSGKNQGMMEVGLDGKVTEHGVTQVTPNDRPNPQTPADTLQTKHGGTPCRDVRDAIENPDKYTIQVSRDGQRTTLAAAIAAGIYEVGSDGSLNFAADNSMSNQETDQANPNRYLTGETAEQLNNLRARMGEQVVDAHILQALANSGGDQMSDKAKAALSRFASDAGAPDVESARQFVNSVMMDVMSSALVDMGVRHPDIDPEEALDFFGTCDERVRYQLFSGLYSGSVTALDNWAERFRLKNRS